MIIHASAIVALLMLATGVLGMSPMQSDTTTRPASSHDPATLTVLGVADIQAAADVIRMDVGVVTEGETAAAALRENSRNMNDVMTALEKVGLTEDEVKTGRFRIRPNYSRRPRQPPADWKPEITGYRVENSVVIRTEKMDEAGAIIEAANDAGANSVGVSGFELSDNRAFRAKAIAAATRNAMEDAGLVAEVASLQLIRIHSISLLRTPQASPEMAMATQRMSAVADGGPPPIVPGDITLSASVTVVYEIAPK